MDNFIQITEPRVGAFVYKNAGKIHGILWRGLPEQFRGEKAKLKQKIQRQ